MAESNGNLWDISHNIESIKGVDERIINKIKNTFETPEMIQHHSMNNQRHCFLVLVSGYNSMKPTFADIYEENIFNEFIEQMASLWKNPIFMPFTERSLTFDMLLRHTEKNATKFLIRLGTTYPQTFVFHFTKYERCSICLEPQEKYLVPSCKDVICKDCFYKNQYTTCEICNTNIDFNSLIEDTSSYKTLCFKESHNYILQSQDYGNIFGKSIEHIILIIRFNLS